MATDRPNTALATNAADEINAEHTLAISSMVDAVEHAIECGGLLIQQKKAMGATQGRQGKNTTRGVFSEWVDDHFDHAFASTDDEEIVEAYGRIMRWVSDQDQFFDAAQAEFARIADGWLVAYAMVNSCIVVTHEKAAPDAKNKVPIPNICQEFGIQYVDTFEMMRRLGIRLSG